MAKFQYRPGDKFGDRFLSAQEFGRYAEDLKLVETPFPERLLEFLEQERLLLPICRVRYPAEIIRSWELRDDPSYTDLSLPVETNPTRLQAAEDLYCKIRDWREHGFLGDTLQDHPLDTIDPAHAEFIERNVVDRSFYPWDTFRVIFGQQNGHAIWTNTVTTYYHYWQALLLAEILGMRISILLNLQDDDLYQKIQEGKWWEIAPEQQRGTINVSTLGTIREFPRYQPAFDALAYYYAYRACAGQLIIKNQGRPPYHLTADQQHALQTQETSIARKTLGQWGLDHQAILNFLKWQCSRWHKWYQRDQQRLTDAYKRNIARTARWYMVLTGKNDDQVIAEVEDIIGHGRPTLEVIFPNWIKVQKEAAARSLKHWIKPTMAPLAGVGYDVSDAECESFLDWIETIGFLQVFWHFERLGEIGYEEDPISLAALAKETEGMGLTIEHLIHHIGEGHPTYDEKSYKTFFWKVKWLWGDNHNIVMGGLGPKSSDLTGVTSDLQASLKKINEVSEGGLHVDIVRDLLKTMLIRNQGAHVRLHGFTHKDLVKLLEVLLRSMILTWKHAKKRKLI
jgi:hypothetical protein